jgi:hypothetical protein
VLGPKQHYSPEGSGVAAAVGLPVAMPLQSSPQQQPQPRRTGGVDPDVAMAFSGSQLMRSAEVELDRIRAYAERRSMEPLPSDSEDQMMTDGSSDDSLDSYRHTDRPATARMAGGRDDSGHRTRDGNIYDWLTDTGSYTGTHKHRFDGRGRGRGLLGRDSVAKGQGCSNLYTGGPVQDIAQIMRSRDSHPSVSLAVANTAGSAPRTPRRRRGGVDQPGSERRGGGSESTPPRTPPRSHGTPPRSTPQQESGQLGRASIFERLTDPRDFTGHHRHRFDEQGNGLGLAGRDYIPRGLGSGTICSRANPGEVRDISQIMRSPMPPKDTVHRAEVEKQVTVGRSPQKRGSRKKKKKKDAS